MTLPSSSCPQCALCKYWLVWSRCTESCVSLECPVLRRAAQMGQEQICLWASLSLLETQVAQLQQSKAKAKQCWCVPSCKAAQELGHNLSGIERAHAGVGPWSGCRALGMKCTPASSSRLLPPPGTQLPSGESSRRSGEGQSFLVASVCHGSCRVALLIPRGWFRAGRGRGKLGSRRAALGAGRRGCLCQQHHHRQGPGLAVRAESWQCHQRIS